MARLVMGRAATAANGSGTNHQRGREVECDRRGGYASAFVTHYSRRGPETSEAIVALLDQPQRFRKASQVSGYIGMVPKACDSGESERRGHITRQGSGLVRSLLVEVAWAGLRHNAWMRQTHQRLSGGKKARKKIAIVAVGRKLLVRCWAMLRDNCAWNWQLRIT